MARGQTKSSERVQAAEPATLAGLLNTQRAIAGCLDLILSGLHQGARAADIQQTAQFLQSLHRQISDQIEVHPETVKASAAQAGQSGKAADGQKN